MPTSLGFFFICPPNVQMSQSRKTILPWNVFFAEVSLICLLPSIPVKENTCFFPFYGWRADTQRLQDLSRGSQSQTWRFRHLAGRELKQISNPTPKSIACGNILHQTNTWLKAKSQEGRMGRIKAEGQSLHPSLLIYCPVRAVTVKDCNSLP